MYLGLAEWLAVVTAVTTAVATAASALLLWRQERRSSLFDTPIVETSEPRREGETIVFQLTVRNTQPATLVLESITIRHPHTFKIYAGDASTYGPIGEPAAFPVPNKRTYRFRSDGSPGWLISPAGSRSDKGWIRVAVLPPAGWSSGSVTFVLRMRLSSVNSRAIKVVFRKFVQHDSSTTTDATAKSRA